MKKDRDTLTVLFHNIELERLALLHAELASDEQANSEQAAQEQAGVHRFGHRVEAMDSSDAAIEQRGAAETEAIGVGLNDQGISVATCLDAAHEVKPDHLPGSPRTVDCGRRYVRVSNTVQSDHVGAV